MKCSGIVCRTQRFGTLTSTDVRLARIAAFANDTDPVDFETVTGGRNFDIEIARGCCKIDAIRIF